jgi:hypothetical protein
MSNPSSAREAAGVDAYRGTSPPYRIGSVAATGIGHPEASRLRRTGRIHIGYEAVSE